MTSPTRQRNATRNLYLLCLSMFLWRMGSAQVIFLQPVYLRLLGANPVQVGLALSTQAVAALIFLLPGGYLSDRFPRKRVMLLSWSLGTLAMIGMAASGTWQIMLLPMIVFGMAAIGNPAMSHYLAELDLERAAWSFALLTASTQFGTMISPTLGAYLAQTYSPRAAYLTSAGFCSLSTLVLTFLGRQPPGGKRSLSESFRPLLRDPILIGLSLPLLAVFLAASLAEAFASNYLRDVAHLPLAIVGRVGSVWALGAAVISLIAGRLTRKQSRLAWALGGCYTVYCLGLALLLGVPALPLGAALALVLLGLAFFLRGAELSGRALVNAHLAQNLQRDHMGAGFAFVNILLAVSQIAAPLLAGWLYARSPAGPFYVSLVALALGGGALVWRVRRKSLSI